MNENLYVIIYRPENEREWHYEQSYFERERELALTELARMQRENPTCAYELHQIPERVFNAVATLS